MYDALQISINDDIVEIIHCKSHLTIYTIIELFVKSYSVFTNKVILWRTS